MNIAYLGIGLSVLAILGSVFSIAGLSYKRGIEEGRKREREWQAIVKEDTQRNEIQKASDSATGRT
jgi:hypothetical protein